MLYFLRVIQGEDLIKIGYSFNPDQRVNCLKTSIPFDIESISYISGNIINEDEIHFMFAKYSKTKEWFFYNKEIEEFIEKYEIKDGLYYNNLSYHDKLNEEIDRLYLEYVLFDIKENIDKIIKVYEAKKAPFGYKCILNDEYKYYLNTHKKEYYIGLLKSIKFDGRAFFKINKRYSVYDIDYFVKKYNKKLLFDDSNDAWKTAKEVLYGEKTNECVSI